MPSTASRQALPINALYTFSLPGCPRLMILCRGESPVMIRALAVRQLLRSAVRRNRIHHLQLLRSDAAGQLPSDVLHILVFILLSGLFTPVSSMPAWAQAIAAVNPFTYLTASPRMLYLNGSTLADISGQLLKITLFAIILNGWAIASYRKRG